MASDNEPVPDFFLLAIVVEAAKRIGFNDFESGERRVEIFGSVLAAGSPARLVATRGSTIVEEGPGFSVATLDIACETKFPLTEM